MASSAPSPRRPSSSIAQYLLGVLAAGGDWGWPATWWASLQTYNPLDLAANGWQAVSLPALLGRLTPGDAAPGSFTGPALVGYVVAALIVLRCLPALRRWSPERAIALACAAGLVISPHAWVYDAALLLPALAVFAADAPCTGLAVAGPLARRRGLRHRRDVAARAGRWARWACCWCWS